MRATLVIGAGSDGARVLQAAADALETFFDDGRTGVTGLDGEVDTIERHQPAVLDGEVPDLQQAHGVAASAMGCGPGRPTRSRAPATIPRTTPVIPSGAVMAVMMSASPLSANT